MNRRRQQIPAGLFILGVILLVAAFFMDGATATILYLAGGFLVLFGSLMAWSMAKR